jgi:hypothetical protein
MMEIGMSTRVLGWIGCGAFFLLTACGGNGSGDGSGGGTPPPPAELIVSSQTISVSAGTADAAPTATIHASISNPAAEPYYFSSSTGNNGIASVTNPSGGTSGDFTLQFKSPSSLGVGTYVDTVAIKACTDSSCQHSIGGSPASVQVTYVVSVKPHIASLGPSIVASGGPGFMLVITGALFDSTSVVQVNGIARPTYVISATSLIGDLTAQDIASAGSVQITVTNYDSSGVTESSPSILTVSSGAVAPLVSEPVPTISASWNTALGGGPIIQQAFTVSVNGPTNATYYYVMSYTGSAVASLGVNGTLQTGTTTPAGPTTGRITGEPNGGLGGTITGSFTGPTLANITVNLIGGSQMGAGTYTDTISLTVCTDSQCAHPIGGPQTVGVTYVVAGNPIPATQFQLSVNTLTIEAPTSAANPPITTTTLSSNGLPPYGAYVFATVLGGSVVSAATFQSDLNGTGTLTLTAKPPSSMGSGIYTDSVQVQVCFDAACSKPASHFPQVIQVTYVVDASVGTDFTQSSIPVEVLDLAYSAVNNLIYATANSDTGGLQHSLVVINPSTASIEQIVSLGPEAAPTTIELSDDGQFAYILDAAANSVVRVQLSSMTIDETVPLTLIEGGYTLKIAPGQPNSFAVETNDANLDTLLIFDGTVQRTQPFSPSSIEANFPFTWGSDDTTIYAYDLTVQNPSMYQLSVSSNGVTGTQQAPLPVQNGEISDIEYIGGLIYSSAGSIYNPSSGVLQTFPLQNTNPAGSTVTAGWVAVDTSLSRAYALTNDTPYQSVTGQTIEGFNLATLQPTWIARFPSINSRIIRWGANGLAFFNGNVLNPAVVVISGSVVTR